MRDCDLTKERQSPVLFGIQKMSATTYPMLAHTSENDKGSSKTIYFDVLNQQANCLGSILSLSYSYSKFSLSTPCFFSPTELYNPALYPSAFAGMRQHGVLSLDVSALHSYTHGSISLHTMETFFPVVHNEGSWLVCLTRQALLFEQGYLKGEQVECKVCQDLRELPARVLADWKRYGMYGRTMRSCAMATSSHFGLRGDQKQKQAYSVGQDYTPPCQHSLVHGPGGPPR
jgi:hypothetical protein